jgi:CheY-like chemotaxis protein
VIDDEAAVRLSMKAILGRRFDVVACANGLEAIQYASDHCGEIYAAFVDHGMPEMDGNLVCSALRSLDATISLIGFSGSEEAAFPEAIFAKLLKKHITPELVLTMATTAVRSAERLRRPKPV